MGGPPSVVLKPVGLGAWLWLQLHSPTTLPPSPPPQAAGRVQVPPTARPSVLAGGTGLATAGLVTQAGSLVAVSTVPAPGTPTPEAGKHRLPQPICVPASPRAAPRTRLRDELPVLLWTQTLRARARLAYTTVSVKVARGQLGQCQCQLALRAGSRYPEPGAGWPLGPAGGRGAAERGERSGLCRPWGAHPGSRRSPLGLSSITASLGGTCADRVCGRVAASSAAGRDR